MTGSYSSGIPRRLSPTSPSTASRSRKRQRFSWIRWHAFIATQIIPKPSGARSSSVIRSTSSSSSSASLSEGRRHGLSAPGLQRNESDETMKEKTTRSGSPGNDDLRREYRFDYSRTKPNRFAPQFAAGSVAVVLDPDVVWVFRTSESVNVLLRSVLAAMPRMAQGGATRRRGGV